MRLVGCYRSSAARQAGDASSGQGLRPYNANQPPAAGAPRPDPGDSGMPSRSRGHSSSEAMRTTLTRRATDESACTPDSVSRDGSRAAAIHLGLPLPAGSCGLPAGSGGQPSDACAGCRLAAAALLGLAPGGVYRATPVARGAGGLLPHRFTLTGTWAPAVCFLWHCPAGHPGLPLATTLPCGVRTFLGGVQGTPTRPPSRLVRRDAIV